MTHIDSLIERTVHWTVLKGQRPPSMVRQAWLEHAVLRLRERFEELGHEVPEKLRVSIGYGKGKSDGKKILGQCWATKASTDEHNEIFITPERGREGEGSISGSTVILAILGHELIHAILGNEVGHKRPFQRLAAQLGLEPKYTELHIGVEFVIWAEDVLKDIGAFPAGAMFPYEPELKKQGNRQLKCVCPECGYIARTTRKNIEEKGPPMCPVDNISFECEEIDKEDKDDE